LGGKVLWRENFPIIRGNYAFFPRITGKFPLQGNSSPILSEICLDFGTVYIKQLMENTSIHVPLCPPDTIPLTLCMEAGVKEKAKQLRIQNYSKSKKGNFNTTAFYSFKDEQPSRVIKQICHNNTDITDPDKIVPIMQEWYSQKQALAYSNGSGLHISTLLR
jgi:hypothetical protein